MKLLMHPKDASAYARRNWFTEAEARAMLTKSGLKRWLHARRPGYGMGRGKATLIHKGRKP